MESSDKVIVTDVTDDIHLPILVKLIEPKTNSSKKSFCRVLFRKRTSYSRIIGHRIEYWALQQRMRV